MKKYRKRISKVELLNAATHALGIVFGVFFIPLLINKMIYTRGTPVFTGIIIYGVCFIITFTLSTLYHISIKKKLKAVFKDLDHLSIYFFIAGTYTTIVFIFFYSLKGLILLSIVWAFVPLGIVCQLLYKKRPADKQVILYLFQGLVFIFFFQSFFLFMSAAVVKLLLTGVLLYMAGIFFFVYRKWKYQHAVWHLFVLAGSICHYAAIYKSIGIDL
jgi:hemolysin III